MDKLDRKNGNLENRNGSNRAKILSNDKFDQTSDIKMTMTTMGLVIMLKTEDTLVSFQEGNNFEFPSKHFLESF